MVRVLWGTLESTVQ